MRVYFNVNYADAESILDDGFAGCEHELFGVHTKSLGPSDGAEGHVSLCLDLSAEEFAKYDQADPPFAPDAYPLPPGDYTLAVVPGEVLAVALGPDGRPQVYDHYYSGSSRRDLLRTAEQWEKGGPQFKGNAIEMRDAIRFLDKIGWLTPLKLREAQTS